MILEGQGSVSEGTIVRQRGYAMAALLVGLSVMAVLMGVMMPVWSHAVQREKETELIFRGQQYARAIGLFQRKFANTAPPTIDLLVEQRFLRKKYKDPITSDDFQPLYASEAPQGLGSPVGASRPGQVGSSNRAVTPPTTPAIQSRTGPTAPGGIIGVTSKSKESSIKIYNGRTKYNEWAFVYVQTAQRPTGPGTGTPGQQQTPGQQRPGQTPSFGGPNMPGSTMPGMSMPGAQGNNPSAPGGRAPRPSVDFPASTLTPIPPPGAPRRPGQ